jgi:uncharacterized membrane protein YkvA (DUF1232 family)
MRSEKPQQFDQAVGQARVFARQKEKVRVLVASAKRKARRHREAIRDFQESLTTLFRLIHAWLTGRYRVPLSTLIFALAAVIYFLNPYDLIPDRIPVFGFLDDAAVVAYVIGAKRGDIGRFLAWERGRLAAPRAG